MTKYGEKYEAPYTPSGEKTIHTTRRAVYRTSGQITPEQSAAIERVEKVVHADKINGDPYRVMRNAEYLGIEITEEYLVGGKWSQLPPNDAELTLMQKGAM